MAYVTTHRENTIDLVRLTHDGNREGRAVIAGEPFTEKLVGSSAGAWGREPGNEGRLAYFISDAAQLSHPTAITAQPRYCVSNCRRVTPCANRAERQGFEVEPSKSASPTSAEIAA